MGLIRQGVPVQLHGVVIKTKEEKLAERAANRDAFIEISAAVEKSNRSWHDSPLDLSPETLKQIGLPANTPIRLVAIGKDCAIIKDQNGLRLLRFGVKQFHISDAAALSEFGQITFTLENRPNRPFKAQLQGKSFFLKDRFGRRLSELGLTKSGEALEEIVAVTSKVRRGLTTIASSKDGLLRIESDASMTNLYLFDDQHAEIYRIDESTSPYTLWTQQGRKTGTLSFEGRSPKASLKWKPGTKGSSTRTVRLSQICDRSAYAIFVSRILVEVANLCGDDRSEHRLYAGRGDKTMLLVSQNDQDSLIRFFIGRLETSSTGFKRIAFTVSRDQSSRLIGTAALLGDTITVSFSKDRRIALRVNASPAAIEFANNSLSNRPGIKNLDIFELSDPDDIEDSLDRELAELSARAQESESAQDEEIDSTDEENLRRPDLHRN